jgi:predicted DsbA family dithiol-disulfide isomerase
MDMPDHLRARMGAASDHVQRMAREAGLEMVTPDRIPNSRRALEAAEYARDEGKHAAFHEAVFDQLYGQGRDIGQWEVLREAAEAAGLDPDAMQAAVDAGQYRDEVEAQFAEARALGITAVPAYVFDNRFAVLGAQPYEVFRDAMGRVTSES